MPFTVDIPTSLAVMRRHRSLMVLVFAIVFVFAALVTLLKPHVYSSSMNILVRSTPPDLVSTPDRASSNNPAEVSEADVNSEVELLTGYDVLKAAVIENKLAKPGIFSSGEQERVDAAVRKLAKELQVTPIRKANIIQVDYEAKSPAMAASVLRSIEAAYVETHLRSQSVPGGYRFFQTQSKYYQQALIDSEHTLADFRRRESVEDLPEQRTLLTQMLVERKGALQASLVSIAQLQHEIAQAGSIQHATSPRHATGTKNGLNQFALDHLTALLADLRNKRTQLRSKFLDNDPLLIEVDKEIAQTEQSLASAKESSTLESDDDVNPAYETMLLAKESREVQLRGELARRDTLQRQVDEEQKVLDHLSDVAGQYAIDTTAVKQAQDNFVNYSKRSEEARVSEQLDQSKITNVVIAQQPTESQLPEPSRLAVNLALSFLFGLAAAAFAAIYVEYRSQSTSRVSLA